jgi:hypothetical protein
MAFLCTLAGLIASLILREATEAPVQAPVRKAFPSRSRPHLAVLRHGARVTMIDSDSSRLFFLYSRINFH